MAVRPLTSRDSAVGGMGRISRAAVIVAPYVTTSIPYAHGTPAAPTITPPRAGPAIIVEFHITWFSASAVGSWSRGTSRGVIAARVGEAMPEIAAVSPAPR